ncbi:hypothetical protein JCM19379_26300 [Methyloparacoccus murrellii]
MLMMLLSRVMVSFGYENPAHPAPRRGDSPAAWAGLPAFRREGGNSGFPGIPLRQREASIVLSPAGTPLPVERGQGLRELAFAGWSASLPERPAAWW